MEKTFYIIQYNDKWGNGDNKSYEGLLEKKEDFDAWLQQHNDEREHNGDDAEDEDEFDLIPINLFTTNTK